MNIDDIPDQEGEIYGQNRTVEILDEPPVYLRSCINKTMNLNDESENDSDSN
jgi:hypothetical protein